MNQSQRRFEWQKQAQLLHELGTLQPAIHTRARNDGDPNDRYSFLGAGLLAMRRENRQYVHWSGPVEADGFVWWAADNTTATLAEYYDLATGTVDDLDAMQSADAPLSQLIQTMTDAPCATGYAR